MATFNYTFPIGNYDAYLVSNDGSEALITKGSIQSFSVDEYEYNNDGDVLGFKFKIVPDSGLEFSTVSASGFYNNDNFEYLELTFAQTSNGEYETEYLFGNYSQDDNFTFNIVAAVPSTPSGEFTFNFAGSNFKLEVVNTSISSASEYSLNETHTVTVSSYDYDNNGDPATIQFILTPFNDVTIDFIDGSGTVNGSTPLTFSFVGDSYVSTPLLGFSDVQDSEFLYSITTSETGGETNRVPFAKSYIVDDEVLTDLSNSPASAIEAYLGKQAYINSLLSVPFVLDVGLTVNENIYLGSLDSGVEAPRLTNNLITVNIGEIVVTGVNNNSIDFESNFELNLPFISDTIDLDVGLVLNKTISIDYVIDIYTMNLTVNVRDGENLVISVNSKIGRNIPIKINQEIISSFDDYKGFYNDIRTAFIRISHPELVENFYSNLVEKYGDLTGVIGYVEVSEIELNGMRLLSDINNVKAILSDGVIIK